MNDGQIYSVGIGVIKDPTGSVKIGQVIVRPNKYNARFQILDLG